jgi:transcriptional regulator with XRE-family HTH domain
MRPDLRNAREARKLSQIKLAELIGKDQAYVSRLESGEYKVDANIAPKLSKVLRISLMRVLYPK